MKLPSWIQNIDFRIPSWSLVLVPILLLVLGFCCNKICVIANDAQMPTYWPGGCTIWNEVPVAGMIEHICVNGKPAKLKFLADWILLSGRGVESPGDVMLDGGFASIGPGFLMWFALILEETGYIKHRRKKTDNNAIQK